MDRLVEVAASVMSAVGLNGTRLLWRWRQYKIRRGEAGVQNEILWRSAKTQHKMCRSCRALVPRDVNVCPDCGTSMAAVSTPGVGRVVSNILPGITAATSLLMLVNGFWFVMMIMAQMKATGGTGSIFAGFDWELLARFGAGVSRAVQLDTGEVIGGEWWRFVTPIFLHAGLLHFFFNSFLLIQLGPIVEEIYGTQRYWVIYLTCGICGNLMSQLPRPVTTVGASGAIMGLIGLLLVYGYRHQSALGESMKQLTFRLVLYTIVLNLFFSIDHLNHLGGFMAGAACAMLVPREEPGGGAGRGAWQALALGGVVLVLLAFWSVARTGPPPTF